MRDTQPHAHILHLLKPGLKSSASTASVSLEYACRSYPRPLGIVDVNDSDLPFPKIMTSSDKLQPSLTAMLNQEVGPGSSSELFSSTCYEYSISEYEFDSAPSSLETPSTEQLESCVEELNVGRPAFHIGHDWGGRDLQRRPQVGFGNVYVANPRKDRNPVYRTVQSEEIISSTHLTSVAPWRNFSDYIPPPLPDTPTYPLARDCGEDASGEAMGITHAIPTTKRAEQLLVKTQGSGWKEEKSQLLRLRGSAAIDVLDSLQSWLDANPKHVERRRLLKLLIELATASNELPRNLLITGVTIESSNPTCFGGCADVFRGSLGGETIAVKRLRINEQGQAREKINQKFCKEGLIWRQLLHPNILPFLGVDQETFSDIQALSMVSPWMGRGTIMDYVRSSEYNAILHRLRLIIGVAQGLEYLHMQKLAHGDLHGSNVFITDDGRPCLADFGLTVVNDTSFSHGTTTTADIAGAARWLAPELLIGNKTSTRKTPAGDVFAFGRLCLAVCTTRRPFHDTPDVSVLFMILQGENPPRPDDSECGGYPMTDELWTIVHQCWATKPERRPDTSSIIHSLRTINDYSLNAGQPRPSLFKPIR